MSDDLNKRCICLQGLLQFTKEKDIYKSLNNILSINDIHLDAISKGRNKSFCFLKFQNEDMKLKFQDLFLKNEIKIKNKLPKIKEASFNRSINWYSIDKLKKIIKDGFENKNKIKNDISLLKDVSLEQMIQNTVQYINIDYENQIENKVNMVNTNINNLIEKAKSEIFDFKSSRITWINKIKLNNFIQADHIDRFNYRNKVELTFGFDKNLNKKLGFNYRIKDSFCIYFPVNLEQIPLLNSTTFYLIKFFDNFFKDSFNYYDKTNREGNLRHLVIKSSIYEQSFIANLVVKANQEELLAITDYCKSIEKIILEENEKYLEKKEYEYIKLMNFKYFTIQVNNEISDSVPSTDDSKLTKIIGNGMVHLKEKILNRLFIVPLFSFLQININQCNKLYELVGNLLNIDENTILLDICSGIGTLGITLGEKAKNIIFVEYEKSACDVIKSNLELNNINKDFKIYNNKVENVIDEICKEYSGKGFKIKGIVDPPRAGLNPNVVKSLRTCVGLDELVYISCDLSQIQANLLDLCGEESKRRRGPSFSPIDIYGADLFPQTKHYETVLYLKRLYE